MLLSYRFLRKIQQGIFILYKTKAVSASNCKHRKGKVIYGISLLHKEFLAADKHDKYG